MERGGAGGKVISDAWRNEVGEPPKSSHNGSQVLFQEGNNRCLSCEWHSNTATLNDLSHLSSPGLEGRTDCSLPFVFLPLSNGSMRNPNHLSILGVSPCSLKKGGWLWHNEMSKMSLFAQDLCHPLPFRNYSNPLISLTLWGTIWQITFSKSVHSISPHMCSSVWPCHSSMNAGGLVTGSIKRIAELMLCGFQGGWMNGKGLAFWCVPGWVGRLGSEVRSGSEWDAHFSSSWQGQHISSNLRCYISKKYHQFNKGI